MADLDQAVASQASQHLREVGAPNPEHVGQHLMGHRQVGRPQPILQGQEPAHAASLDGVSGVAGDRLQHLRQQAVGVAHEQVANGLRGVLGLG